MDASALNGTGQVPVPADEGQSGTAGDAIAAADLQGPRLDVRPIPEVALREHALRKGQHPDDAFRERARRGVRVVPAEETR